MKIDIPLDEGSVAFALALKMPKPTPGPKEEQSQGKSPLCITKPDSLQPAFVYSVNVHGVLLELLNGAKKAPRRTLARRAVVCESMMKYNYKAWIVLKRRRIDQFGIIHKRS